MNTDGAGLILVILFAGCCIAGFVVWLFAAYHLFKTTRNFLPNRAWGKYIPISIFMPYLFTETGNYHRSKFLKMAGIFIFLVATAFALGIINENLETKSYTQVLPNQNSGQASS